MGSGGVGGEAGAEVGEGLVGVSAGPAGVPLVPLHALCAWGPLWECGCMHVVRRVLHAVGVCALPVTPPCTPLQPPARSPPTPPSAGITWYCLWLTGGCMPCCPCSVCHWGGRVMGCVGVGVLGCGGVGSGRQRAVSPRPRPPPFVGVGQRLWLQAPGRCMWRPLRRHTHCRRHPAGEACHTNAVQLSRRRVCAPLLRALRPAEPPRMPCALSCPRPRPAVCPPPPAASWPTWTLGLST